jgi:glutamyl/glutaminyl-tRNA synthetase
VIEALLKYADKLEDLVKEAAIIFSFAPEKDLAESAVQETLSQAGAKEVIREFHDLLQQHELLNLETYKKVVGEVKAATGYKGQQLFHPIRVALTGRNSGVELDRLIPILEQAEPLELPVKIVPAKERAAVILDYLSSNAA